MPCPPFAIVRINLHCIITQMLLINAAYSSVVQCTAHDARPNSMSMVRSREVPVALGAGGWSPAQSCHMSAFHAGPCQPRRIVDNLPSRIYIGQFSPRGDQYIGEQVQAFVAISRHAWCGPEDGMCLAFCVHFIAGRS